MITTEELTAAFEAAPNAFVYRLTQRIEQRCIGRAVLYARGDLELDTFARGGQCELAPSDGVAAQFNAWIDEHGVVQRDLDRGAFHVRWRGEALDVICAQFSVTDCEEAHHWIVARTLDVAQALLHAVRRWDGDASAEILVFDADGFRRSAKLHAQIRGAKMDELVLTGELGRELSRDVTRWKNARELYARHRIPWKRGLLLIGPPGNGKTHAIRALVNELGVRCIYVRTFKMRHWEESEGIRRVFERARNLAPCVLVLEDLDALVSEHNRSALLNELDGFAANEGILTLASTNHPERLDRSILDRPSRFDRKFHFGLPATAERLAYLRRWAATLNEEMRPSVATLEWAAEKSCGFTFAYLKELGLGAMMRWVADANPEMDATLRAVLATLREEMSSTTTVLGPLPHERKIGLVQLEG